MEYIFDRSSVYDNVRAYHYRVRERNTFKHAGHDNEIMAGRRLDENGGEIEAISYVRKIPATIHQRRIQYCSSEREFVKQVRLVALVITS